MIKLALIFLILLCAYKIFRTRHYLNCFLWFMLGMYLIHPYAEIFRFSYSSSRLVLILAFIARLCKDRILWSNFKVFPAKIELTLMFVFLIIQPFFTHWSGLNGVNWGFQDFLTTYFLFLLGFSSLPRNVNLWRVIQDKMYIIIIAIVVIGYLSFFMTENFISVALSSTGEVMWSSDRALSDRGFRSTGTQFSPNIFGLINATLIMLVVHFEKRAIYKYASIGFLLMNIFFCGTRAPFVVLLLSLIIYGLYVNKKQMMKSILFFIPFLALLLYFLKDNEIIQSYVGGVADLFLTGGTNTSGSSIELRDFQMTTAVAYFSESPITGHGVNYTINLINEKGLFYNRYNSMLAGAEGYPFYLMIDYGILYTVLVLAFLLKVFWQFTRHNTSIRSISIGLLCAEVIFIATSQPGHSWEIIFPWLGLFMRYTYNATHIHYPIHKKNEYSISMR